MNIKALLAKCISLLYRESQLEEESDSSKLVNDIISSLKINNRDISGTDSTLNDLKDLVLDMVSRENPIPYNDLIQHLKIICAQDTTLFESIQDNIAFELTPQEVQRSVLSYRFELSKYLKNKKAQDILEKLTYDLKIQSR